MPQSDDSRKSVGRSLPWPVRFVLVKICVIALVLVWTTNRVMTQRFVEASRSDAEVQLALISGNLTSELERQKIVPLMLSRDPVLTEALAEQEYNRISERLSEFRLETGSAALMLLDAQGTVVAATEQAVMGQDLSATSLFQMTVTRRGTVFSALADGDGRNAFYYSREIRDADRVLGVLVVQVNLHKFLYRWTRLADAVVLIDQSGTVVLSTEAGWTGFSEANLDIAVAAADWIDPNGNGMVFGLPKAILKSNAPLRTASPVDSLGWTLVTYTTQDGVRERVNSVLAMEIMGFAVLLAGVFFAMSRQAEERSRRFARESDRLRRLNQRLQEEIAERERAERNLQVAELSLAQSSKLAALGEMSAAVSHELNQPLAAMKTYLAGARLLIQRARYDEAVASFIRIDGLIDRMGAITRQLKAHARRETGELVPTDLRDCVSSALDMMAPQISRSGVRVNCVQPEGPVVVLADPVRVEQVIVNLVRNAFDATQAVEAPKIDLVLTLGDVASLTVRDNGTGISDLKNLFEPFYTTKAPGEGVGLGLAISSSIIKSLGGRLTARNGDEGGAIFKIDLPLATTANDEPDDMITSRPTAAE